MDMLCRELWIRWITRLCFCAICAANPEVFAQGAHTNWWNIELGCGQSDVCPAIGRDGTIYVGTFGQTFFSITTNGTVKWRYETSSEIKSSAAIATNGTIYFGCRDRKLYALTEAGQKKWEFMTGGWVDSSPALAADGTIYFGSWDKNFYALNPNGSLKWKFQTGAEIDSSPAVGRDGTIYFGSHDKKFYAMHPGGGKKWEFETGGAIISSPALNGEGMIYFTSVDGILYCLDEEGHLEWRLKTGGITESSPVLGSDGTIYLGVNEYLRAVTPAGKEKWYHFVFDLLDSAPAVVEGDWIYVNAPFHALYAFDRENKRDWYFARLTYGDAMSPAIGVDGTVYTMTNSRILIGLDTTARLARTPWPKFRGNARNTGNVSDGP
jgi:outer membrane protein assembly factor BamB